MSAITAKASRKMKKYAVLTREPRCFLGSFDFSWEQRKFSDVVATRRGLTYKPSDIRENGVRVLRSSNIAEDSFVLSDEDVFVVREAVNIDCVRANDILITAANGSSRLVGKHTIISGIPEESAVHGGFMLLGTTKEPHFVNASMGSSWYRRFIELFVAGGNGAIGNLNKNDLDNQDIAIPSEKEQKKIGSFFRQLDNLITLHQRKFEKLTNVKKSMLEKMFPQNGSSYPEIRFKGFTDPWEQRKLGELATEMIAGGDVDKELLLEEGHYPVIANALTNDGIVGYYNDQYRIKAPAVTVTGRGDVGHAKARNVDFTPVVRLLSIKTNHDVYFLENAINTLKIVIESTGVPQLTVPQLAKYEISFPKALKEEEKIGQYFANLDHLITLHQRELEKLQNIKKSMLEKMFV